MKAIGMQKNDLVKEFEDVITMLGDGEIKLLYIRLALELAQRKELRRGVKLY